MGYTGQSQLRRHPAVHYTSVCSTVCTPCLSVKSSCSSSGLTEVQALQVALVLYLIHSLKREPGISPSRLPTGLAFQFISLQVI